MDNKYRSIEQLFREMVSKGTAARRKVPNVGRPDTAANAMDPKSTLYKQGQIQNKIIDEEEQIDEVSKEKLTAYSAKAGDTSNAKDEGPRKSYNRLKGMGLSFAKRNPEQALVKPKVAATEEVELEELKKSTVASYKNKAETDRSKSYLSAERSRGYFSTAVKDLKNAAKRSRGIDNADKKLSGTAKVNATEEVEIDEGHKVGDKVHAGFGAKGGAGFKGTVHKVEDGFVHINVGKGKYGDRIVKAPKHLVTKEEVEIKEANFKAGDKVSYETSKSNKNNKGVVHSVKGDTVTVKGSNYLGGEVLHDVHHSMVRKEEAEIKEASVAAINKNDVQSNSKDVDPPTSRDKKKKGEGDMDDKEAKTIKGGKTDVDLNPKTDDNSEDETKENGEAKTARKKANKEIGAKGVKEETMTSKHFGLPESLIQTVSEALKGGQKKLDKNHNGKLDGQDFKMLRKEDKSCACEGKGPCQCPTNEEAEQIDELTGIKKSPLKKIGYVLKAGERMTKTPPHEIANNPTTARKFGNTLKTLKKMTKEEVELSAEELARIEAIAKSL
jgi:hypothetical protein